ncbi:MAG: GspH/FimT family pseudopilin [Phycisphaerae bacterium]
MGGFTLIELVLVLIVVGVVLALCAPRMKGFFTSRQAADAATSLVALTKCARSHAIAQGLPCRLNVDAKSGQYWLTIQQAGQFVSPAGDMGQRYQVPDGAAVSLRIDSAYYTPTPTPGVGPALTAAPARGAAPEPAYIQFYPSGRCDAATISVTDMQGQVFQITCPSATDSFRVIAPSEAR